MLVEKLLLPLYLCINYFLEVATGFRVDATRDRPSKTPISIPCVGDKDTGNCGGQEEAWYYDHTNGRCLFFIYSGCGGNGNRFSSLSSCKKSCAKHQSKCKILNCPPGCKALKRADGCPKCSCSAEIVRSTCLQEQKKGSCRAIRHKWSYSKEAKKCVKFVYGGCEGNSNNFRSKEECELICGLL